MASFRTWHCLLASCCLFLLHASAAHGQLSPSFYATTCPMLGLIVRATMIKALLAERRMGASLVRLFFHDCFVQGCDGSILLDDVGSFVGEKGAGPNVNSVRGFEVIDQIKANVELICPGVVSCADIVALAARDGTFLLGGPSWAVPLGRRDSTTASLTLANSDLPSPASGLATLISWFANKGLSATDMTALSGAYSIGFAQCKNYRSHIYNDININKQFANTLRSNCSPTPGATDTNLAPLDTTTQLTFDNAYFGNLVKKKGLLHSDQELFNGGSQDALVQQYSTNPTLFASDFVTAMIKMGNISPLTGTAGQIRANSGKVN
ncbi:peroxidase 70-like [Miscanthus floridulus]|uniref:peroxidase 70-like n=1 Tax=Miscanthus floridulus TaxID=154761 RepID=UPI0034599EF6